MRNVWAVTRRELVACFESPLAYIALPVFLGLVAVFTLGFQDIFSQDVASLRPFFTWTGMFLLFLVPAITMRLFAEERRTGSIELLVTLPISEREVVLGKYLSALGMVAIALLLTLTYPITIATLGDLDPGPVLGGYLGLFLVGATFAAVGTAAGTFTSNQVVSFLLAFFFCLLPYASGFFLHRVPSTFLPLVQYISFDYHFQNMARGVLDTRNLVFFLLLIALSLHVAVFSLRNQRLC